MLFAWLWLKIGYAMLCAQGYKPPRFAVVR